MEELITERLNIRRFTENDGPSLFNYLSKEEVVHFEPYPPFTKEQSDKEALRRAQDKSFWAVCLNDGTLIGNLYFSKGEFDTWMIGYVFNNEYWGQGYATEAVNAIFDYGFQEWGVRRIIALCNPLNTPSWQLLERIGMRREGELKQNVFFNMDEQGKPIWQDTYEYGLLKNEYMKNKANS
ncbi:GNAT family N-acetyltransferase [Enterococcus sp. LJL51]|uniref:GNAT family N-acetyltransferase n=1 Tax=Enterococcus sp. LJL51 TaxID=3416656 RepID=UPI003CFB74E3